MKSAVLLLVFNRPDTTQKVFDVIRRAMPPRLYIVADGPRPGNLGDEIRCKEVRKIISNIDWSCEVFKVLREENLGTKYGIAKAIDWFFSQEEEGIILEDDILPLPSFFKFCDEMLNFYRDNSKIAVISGNNSIATRFSCDESYFFSKYPFTWGWATWRRAWKHFDISMKYWPAWQAEDKLKGFSDGNIFFESHWTELFNTVYSEKLNTCWDHQWLFNNWHNQFLSVMPKYNLIKNIGFGTDATHTIGDTPDYMLLSEPKDIEFPLVHPAKTVRNIKADKLIDKFIIYLTFKNAFLNRLRRSFMGPFLRNIKRKLFNK